jgi:hypothetical protein
MDVSLQRTPDADPLRLFAAVGSTLRDDHSLELVSTFPE